MLDARRADLAFIARDRGAVFDLFQDTLKRAHGSTLRARVEIVIHDPIEIGSQLLRVHQRQTAPPWRRTCRTTAAGRWFRFDSPTYPEEPHLALVHDNFNPGLGVFSVGTPITEAGPRPRVLIVVHHAPSQVLDAGGIEGVLRVQEERRKQDDRKERCRRKASESTRLRSSAADWCRSLP